LKAAAQWFPDGGFVVVSADDFLLAGVYHLSARPGGEAVAARERKWCCNAGCNQYSLRPKRGHDAERADLAVIRLHRASIIYSARRRQTAAAPGSLPPDSGSFGMGRIERFSVRGQTVSMLFPSIEPGG
jgi:hypothetical protein